MNTENPTNFFITYDGLISSPFLLFDAKLEDVMIAVAKYSLIYQIVDKCLKGYNYLEDKRTLQISKDINTINLNKKDFVAFGFSCFYEIFNKKITLTNYLEKNFNGETVMQKYDNFIKDLVIPLKKNVESIIEDMKQLYAENSTIETLKNNYLTEKNEQLNQIIDNFNFRQEDKAYFDYFFDNLQRAECKEVCFVAIKYLLNSYPNGEELLDKIMEIY